MTLQFNLAMSSILNGLTAIVPRIMMKIRIFSGNSQRSYRLENRVIIYDVI